MHRRRYCKVSKQPCTHQPYSATNPYSIDPLCHAVEAAWKKGITVVAATGNAGYYMTPGGPGLTSPARDPYVISVGNSDPRGTTTVTDRVGSQSPSWLLCSSRAASFAFALASIGGGE